MKYFYLTIALFFSLNSFSQDDILGEWFLQSIIIDGVQSYNIPDNASIDFTTDPGDNNGFALFGNGACNGFYGSYITTSASTLDIVSFAQTLVGCDTSEETAFEYNYFYTILSSGDPVTIDYAVSGTGNNATLTLTNVLTNNVAIYGAWPPNDLSGEWFLHYIEIDGVEQYSTIPNSSTNFYTTKNIFFNDDNSFSGVVCNNGYGGIYHIVDDTTVTIYNVTALAGYCDYPIESQLFLHPYLWTVLSDSNFENDNFNYAISGVETNETLVLTNSENNKAIYGRQPLPESRLPGTWHLHTITKNGVEELNTFEPTFSIDFTFNRGSFSSLDYGGSAICNNYFGEYHLKGIDTISVIGFGATLALCSDTNADTYESLYGSFFDDYDFDPDTEVILNYAVSESGNSESLVLTDLNGDFLTYGRQTLSIDENTLNNLSIHLKENPVKDELKLDINQSLGDRFNYEISSIDGKKILNGQLFENHSINLETLDSGIYFLAVFANDNYRQTLKFVKE